jgi:hypothetical protein
MNTFTLLYPFRDFIFELFWKIVYSPYFSLHTKEKAYLRTIATHSLFLFCMSSDNFNIKVVTGCVLYIFIVMLIWYSTYTVYIIRLCNAITIKIYLKKKMIKKQRCYISTFTFFMYLFIYTIHMVWINR